MKNIFLEICFNGSFYHGWQIQPNAKTVQQTLKDAVERITGESVNLIGCSRTDADVHANSFCCNFRTQSGIAPQKFSDALNSVLPENIAVKQSKQVHDNFHARYDCLKKTYVYKILNSRTRNPFMTNLCYLYSYHIDDNLLNMQSKDYIGKHDFTSFCASGSSAESKIRTIYDFKVERNNDEVFFTVEGDGFLYNMVRIMVGTLLEINNGKIERDTIKQIILEKKREKAGITVPGHGLYLDKVFYGSIV